MRIGVDIDEVLADLLNSVLALYNCKHGTSFKRNDFHTYNWWEILGIGKDRNASMFYDFMNSDSGKNILPIAGSVEGVKEISKKHELYAVTSRQNDFKRHTEEFLDRYFKGLIREVYFGNHMARDGGLSCTKLELMNANNLGLLIDDSYGFATECSNGGIPVLLYDAPWNRRGSLPINVQRVYSWKEIVEKTNT